VKKKVNHKKMMKVSTLGVLTDEEEDSGEDQFGSFNPNLNKQTASMQQLDSSF